MAMAMTSKTHPYKAGFEPFPGEVYRIPYAYCYRCSYSKTYPSCEVHCARHFEDTFKRVVAAEDVAAVIVEPIMGEGGFITPPAEFFPILTEICRKYNILVIADEVQTGFSRTGALFACERLGLEPDLITMAKSLTGGLPMAAVTGRAEIMDTPASGQLGGTFSGNPASCAAALAVLDIIEKENLNARANIWVNVSANERRDGNRNGIGWRRARVGRNASHRAGSFAIRPASPRTKKPNRWHNIAMSTAWC